MSETGTLAKLSESVADGDAIDWEAVCALAGDDDIRQLVEHLRVVAGVADVHRSQIAETIAAETAPLSPEATGALQGPRRWGHLVLVRKIGEGAFGEVYEALDTWLDHPRALKLLKPEVANRVSAPQILHEARKLVRVRHPNVVTVHGADRHDGRVGFWMDLIEGQTLEQRVREGRLSAGEATYIGQELCRALAAVHHANLVHRDIKAQNVMRASDGGRIILMDFGAGEFRDATSPGRPHGTPLYLAPEIITGGTATVQSDIYALGVLLYYLVTGRFPVEGTSLSDLALAHARRQRRHLRDARPDLPDSFVNVVERATDRDPARRFRSAGDFHSALEERDDTRSDPLIVPRNLTSDAGRSTVDAQLPLVNTLVAALRIIGAAAGTVVAIGVCGLVACRSFDTVLTIPSEFATRPSQYFRVGTEALLPFVLNWVFGIAFVAIFAGIRLALGSRTERLLGTRWRLESLSPATVATLIPLAAAIVWLSITSYYWPIVDTLSAVHAGTPVNPPRVPLLDMRFSRMVHVYSEFAAILSFLLVYVVWRWWPWLEQRAEDATGIRRMKWVSLALAAVMVLTAVGPRRFAMETFDRVLYKNQRSYVIGTSGDVLLLYVADSVDRVRPRVKTNDVVRTNVPEPLTGPLPTGGSN
jgi:serine/threonine protein kinase